MSRQARLQAMDDDGIGYSVLYPSLAGFCGERFGALADPELALACVQAYNDWLIDEWVKTSNRFIPQCIVPLSPIDATVAEIRRAVGRGHRGVIFPAAPMQLGALPHINGAEYDPVWAVCQELEIPLCFRAGSAPELFQFPTAPQMATELAAAMQAVTRSASAVFDLTNILFSRILLRFPKLKVIFAESTIGWGTYLLEYADHQYEQDHCDYPLKPSEMFHRQCYLTTWYDEARINARHVGVDNILWSTQFSGGKFHLAGYAKVRGKMSNGHESELTNSKFYSPMRRNCITSKKTMGTTETIDTRLSKRG